MPEDKVNDKLERNMKKKMMEFDDCKMENPRRGIKVKDEGICWRPKT